MLNRYFCFAFLLLSFSNVTSSETLNKLANIDFDQADFYLLDVSDEGVKVSPSIDSYVHRGDLFIAVTPLFEGLRLKYSLIGNKLSVSYAENTEEFSLLEEEAIDGQWFYDGSFIFVKADLIEQWFSTRITSDTNTLKMNFSGHKTDFPYKTIKSQQKQRRLKNLVIDRSPSEPPKYSGAVITIEDEYRLATVPTGFANIEYKENDRNERYSASMQMEADLAYHSASITLNHNNEDTDSRVLFSRYPQYPGDKILGIWDTYSFGDLYLRQSTLTPGTSRGLGIDFSANVKGNFNENMTTSFSKTARPGWDADVYHNGVFLETRVVPADGLMEFNNLEVFYGANEFKIVLYGPFGEQETLIEQVSVRNNGLGQGDYSYGLSFKENDSSLLDIDPSEFDIDAIGGNFNIGLFDNWQIGLNVSLYDINNPEGGSESYRISNQLTFPGWFFQNNIAINPNNITQASSLATSFLNNDNFILNYDSRANDDENQPDESILSARYNIKLGPTTNNISYENSEFSGLKTESLQYRFSYYNRYLNVTNSLNYTSRTGTEDRFSGVLNLTTNINRTLRLVASIPYEINGEETVDSEQITASVLYSYRHGDYNHQLNASNSSFFEENRWSIGYNLAVNKPTHQLTLRTLYNSDDNWSLTAGVAINFGYDYFNNEMVFSSKTLRNAGSLDVHTYLDRQLNGIPDVLDYDLSGVTFSGGPSWDDVETNQDGQARLFGANNGITALSAQWQTGSSSVNNDYIIYSHPGSLQRVNLPFYLTTEVELFVVIANGSQALTLANVPLMADNIATGDSYAIDTDFDGYASFVDLLPGTYNIYVDKQFLKEKGLQAEIGGFEFTSPLRGGFVVLPNIELARSENGDIGKNHLQRVLLDEYNYEPLLNSENDKLIHLPPKGGMKAPYSSDKLGLAVFKEIKTQSTELERKELRRKLAEAAQNANQLLPVQPNIDSPSSQSNTIDQNKKQTDDLSSPEIQTMDEFAPQNATVQISPMQPEAKSSVAVQPIAVEEKQPAQRIDNDALVEVPTKELIEHPVISHKLDLSTGYVVQYAALKSLDIAKAMTKNYLNTERLYIARKVVKGQSYYCLISEVLADQRAVAQYLKTAEKDGFMVPATNYLETIWSK